MNGRCHLPEKQRLPNLRRVSFFLSTCPPLQDRWQGASIDIKAAHKRMLIREDERGALLFQFEKRLYAYRTAHFGAKTSAWHWGRVSGALLRLRQAKRKLDSSSSEHLHANKRNKTVIQVKFSSCNPAARHVEYPKNEVEPNSLQSANDVNVNSGCPSDSSQHPMKAPSVNAPAQTDGVRHVDQGLFVEIFSGTAGLTAAVRKVGLHSSVGIDSSVNTQCKAPVIRLDLRLDHAKTLLWQILNRPNLIGVHLAPPCGTASRAREIVRKSGPSPPPLRSEKWPDGFPWLRGLNRDRVRSANMLYDLTGQIVRHCIDIGVVVSVENPARSHFWATAHFSKHVRHLEDKLFRTFFHHCMHGSRRRKHTLLLHICRSLCKLAVLCDGVTPTRSGATINNGLPHLKPLTPLCCAKDMQICWPNICRKVVIKGFPQN